LHGGKLCLDLLTLGRERRLERFYVAVAEHQLQTHAIGVVRNHRCRVSNEALIGPDGIILNVPAARALTFHEAGQAFTKDLALSVRLSPDRIVPKNEAQRKHPPAREYGFVTTR